jgi:hypothetical protein
MPAKKKIEQPFDENEPDEGGETLGSAENDTPLQARPTHSASALNQHVPQVPQRNANQLAENHHAAYESDDSMNPLLNGGVQHAPHCPRCAALARANAVRHGDNSVGIFRETTEETPVDESRQPYRTTDQQYVKKGQHVFNEDGELIEYDRVPRPRDPKEPMDPVKVQEDELRASRPWRDDEEPLQK